MASHMVRTREQMRAIHYGSATILGGFNLEGAQLLPLKALDRYALITALHHSAPMRHRT